MHYSLKIILIGATTFAIYCGWSTTENIRKKQNNVLQEKEHLQNQLLIEQQEKQAIQNELNYWKSLCPGQ